MANGMDYPSGATPLDPDEMEGLKFKHVTTRGELDQLEQAAITEGMNWLLKQKNPELLTESFVCELHKKLFGTVWKWAGTFRKTEKNIGCDPLEIGVELRKLLDDMRYWLDHNTFEPREMAARFHHRLVSIHPFPNGNGRHARIMADAVLTKLMKSDPIDWAGGYDLQALSDRREHYIYALKAADKGDYQPLFKFVGI